MGRPVVHFEIMGKDAAAFSAFDSELFEGQIDANNAMNYGTVSPEGNTLPDGTGSAAASGRCRRATAVTSPSTSRSLR